MILRSGLGRRPRRGIVRRLPVLLVAAFATAGPSFADPATLDDAPIPFDSPRWKHGGETFHLEEHLGRPAVFMQNAQAALPDVTLLDGVVEVDIAFEQVRGFSGVMWRGAGPGEHEELYLRPHQSGNPDANQYTPAFHGTTGWQLYYGPSYAAPTVYRYDAWQRLKVVFEGSRAAVYLDSEEPILIVPELKRAPEAGYVGLLSSFGPAWFSDFRVRPLRDGEHVPAGGTLPPEAPPGIVSSWEVSTPFDHAVLDGRLDLPRDLVSTLAWTSLAVERSGVANLSRVAALAEGHDTVLARVAVEAATQTAKRVRFGYSDDVRVYLDGRLLYGGSNRYESRDYRYLGTIGFFDEVYLDLAPGRHELTFAVRERFGGWGIQAVIEDL